MTQAVSVKPSRRTRWSWYFYDFGNSAYAAIILLAVFSTYFSNVVVGGVKGPTYWNYAVAIAAIIVAVISPIMGTIADFSKAKKKFLMVFTTMSVIFTAMLFFVQKGDIFLGMLFFILAEIGYRASQVFYDSLLVDVSTPETIGSVSGKGWALGMLGGIACLLIVLVPIQKIGGTEIVRVAFLITALFYALSSIPTLLWVKQVNEPEILPKGETTLGMAFKKLGATFKAIKSFREFIKYTIAFLIYNDGIMMLMDNAALIGAILFGFKTEQLIILIIILHIAGAAGAFLFGWISNKYSSKQALVISLIMLILVVLAIFFIKTIPAFFVVGGLAGFALSGVQAVSRTMVSQLSPVNKTAEFFGFLSVAGRTSTFIGPLVFGTFYGGMAHWYINRGVAEATAKSYGILWAVGSVIAFLLIGMLFLLRVQKVTHRNPLKFDIE